MKKFIVDISYLNKKKESKTIENTNNLMALTYVLNSLSLDEKDNVIGLKVRYISPQYDDTMH